MNIAGFAPKVAAVVRKSAIAQCGRLVK